MKSVMAWVCTVLISGIATAAMAQSSDRCHMLHEFHHWGNDQAVATTKYCHYDVVDIYSNSTVPNELFYGVSTAKKNWRCPPRSGVAEVTSCVEKGSLGQDVLTGSVIHHGAFYGDIYKNTAGLTLNNLPHGLKIIAPLVN